MTNHQVGGGESPGSKSYESYHPMNPIQDNSPICSYESYSKYQNPFPPVIVILICP